MTGTLLFSHTFVCLFRKQWPNFTCDHLLIYFAALRVCSPHRNDQIMWILEISLSSRPRYWTSLFVRTLSRWRWRIHYYTPPALCFTRSLWSPMRGSLESNHAHASLCLFRFVRLPVMEQHKNLLHYAWPTSVHARKPTSNVNYSLSSSAITTTFQCNFVQSSSEHFQVVVCLCVRWFFVMALTYAFRADSVNYLEIWR